MVWNDTTVEDVPGFYVSGGELNYDAELVVGCEATIVVSGDAAGGFKMKSFDLSLPRRN